MNALEVTRYKAGSSSEALNATVGSHRAAMSAARLRVAHCVLGQARGFTDSHKITDALFGGAKTDVFAVIDVDCRPARTCAVVMWRLGCSGGWQRCGRGEP
jgi:hypothetical protein